jgi:hypothetical protein
MKQFEQQEIKMTRVNSRTASALFVFGALALSVTMTPQVQAQTARVDPVATQTLQRMTDYLGSLKQFSLHTQNTLEDMLDSGQRIDIDVSANVIISRPNKLVAERKGELLDQAFYYNGKTLTLYNPPENIFATEPAPATIEEMLDYVRESLGLIIPASDLIYRNAYPLLMQGVTSATVIGKTVINGVTCDHLAFRRPDVDFQVWVAVGDQPLPCKYVVTDTGTDGMLSISTVTSDWNVAPAAADASFNFVPPEGSMGIMFMPLDASSGTFNASGANE